jgi:hypothetical protein
VLTISLSFLTAFYGFKLIKNIDFTLESFHIFFKDLVFEEKSGFFSYRLCHVTLYLSIPTDAFFIRFLFKLEEKASDYLLEKSFQFLN